MLNQSNRLGVATLTQAFPTPVHYPLPPLRNKVQFYQVKGFRIEEKAESVGVGL